jgi:hypothetical protein
METMKTKTEADSVVTITCETLIPKLSAPEVKDAIKFVISEVAKGGDVDDLDKEGKALAKTLRAKKFSSTVSVDTEGMGSAPELLSILVTLGTGGGVVAYDVWKRIVLPRLEVRWGRPALQEQAKQERKAKKAADKQAKKHAKLAAKEAADTEVPEKAKPSKKSADGGDKTTDKAAGGTNAGKSGVKKSTLKNETVKTASPQKPDAKTAKLKKAATVGKPVKAVSSKEVTEPKRSAKSESKKKKQTPEPVAAKRKSAVKK